MNRCLVCTECLSYEVPPRIHSVLPTTLLSMWSVCHRSLSYRTTSCKSCSPFLQGGATALQFHFLRRSLTLLSPSLALLCKTFQSESQADSLILSYLSLPFPMKNRESHFKSKKLLASCKSLFPVNYCRYELHTTTSTTSARSSLMQQYLQLPPGFLYCPTKSSVLSHIPKVHLPHTHTATSCIYLIWLLAKEQTVQAATNLELRLHAGASRLFSHRANQGWFLPVSF